MRGGGGSEPKCLLHLMRLTNRWEPPPTPHTTINSKLQDRAEIEQYSEKKVNSLYEMTPKQFLNCTPTPKIVN